MAEQRKFVRYETLVDELHEVWGFVMSHVDEFTSLNVEIHGEYGFWDEGDEEMRVKYRAAVYGDVEGGW